MKSLAILFVVFILASHTLLAQELALTGELDITKKVGSESALDIHLDVSGDAMRFYRVSLPDPVTYFNDGGAFYSRLWAVISGSSTGTGGDFNISHPSNEPFMLALWSDIPGPTLQARASQSPGSYNFSGLDSAGNSTFSIEEFGALQWGTSTRAAMDVGLARSAAGALKVTDAAGGFGALLAGKLHMEPQVAPLTCSMGSFYFDPSSAICACMTVNAWSRVFGAGTCG